MATAAPATNFPATSVSATSVSATSWRKRTGAQGAQQDLSPEEKVILYEIEKRYFGNVETYYKFVQDVMALLRNWPQLFTTREL